MLSARYKELGLASFSPSRYGLTQGQASMADSRGRNPVLAENVHPPQNCVPSPPFVLQSWPANRHWIGRP
jgi:hypothetical protein